jgi:ABC-type phosphate transport system substrate-binding protein
MRRVGLALLIITLAWMLAGVARADSFQVVAHSGVEGSKISRSLLAEIYRKDVMRWGDEVRILPVDQSSVSGVREAFTREVLGLSLGEAQEFWNQRLVMDRELPPVTRGSDEDVLAYVAGHEGAIGYVASGIEIPDDIKLLTVVD